MKILELAEFYSEQGGGVRTYIGDKFTAAHAAGHSLSIVAPGREDRIEERAGGKVIWVKSPAIPGDARYHLFWNQAPIDEIVARERPDFIEGSSPWRGAWIAGRQSAKIPKALVFHQDPVLTYPRTLLRNLVSEERIDAIFAWFFRYLRRLQSLFDTSIVASSWMSERFSRLGLQPPQVVRFGVNRGAIAPDSRSHSLRAQMLRSCNISAPDAKLLITISRHHPEKRIPLMIDAVKAASTTTPIGLFIVGDGPMRHRIEKMAAGVGGVYVAGYVRDRQLLSDMLCSADAYIHGCPAETFGIVIAEALCAGLPLIVPNAGGAAEIATHECAEFYAPDQADECARAIARLITRDPVQLQHAARAAADRINTTNDPFQELFSTYEKIADRRSRECGGRDEASIGNSLALCQQLA
jgi:alpha-1,6-mannosyltransferase